MMHSVNGIVPFVEVVCKGLFLIQALKEEQDQALAFNHSQHCFGYILHFRVYSYDFYSDFFISILLLR